MKQRNRMSKIITNVNNTKNKALTADEVVPAVVAFCPLGAEVDMKEPFNCGAWSAHCEKQLLFTSSWLWSEQKHTSGVHLANRKGTQD